MSPTSSDPPADVQVEEPEYDDVGSVGLATADVGTTAVSRVLIVKDCQPWGVDANERVLDEMGVDTTVVPSTQLDTLLLSVYDAIVIPSTQTGTYYQRLADNRGKLATFVENGGTLFAHVTDYGWPCTTRWSESFLPGGVNKVTTYRDSIDVDRPSHPVADGLSDQDLSGWGWSTHGYLTNLPSEAKTIFSSAGDPTFVEYGHGEGTVLATMQTVEWPWAGSGSRQLLRNELSYQVQSTIVRDGVVTTLSFFPGLSEDSSSGGDELNSTLPDYNGHAVDDWFHGDYWTELPDSLQAAERTFKQPEEFDDVTFQKFRFRNQIRVHFETDGRRIDKGSVWFRYADSTAHIGLEGEGNPLRKVKDVLFDGDDFKQATPRERLKEWEITEIDGVEAVRVSSIWGTYDPYVSDLLWYIKLFSAASLVGLLGIVLASAVVEFIFATPTIYTWVEYFHLADGRELVRVPDASRFPGHVGYLGDQKYDETEFEMGDEWAVNEYSNSRFDEWVAEAESHFASPYGSSRLGYREYYQNGHPLFDGGPHPVMVYGVDENGVELSSASVEALLPDDPLEPF